MTAYVSLDLELRAVHAELDAEVDPATRTILQRRIAHLDSQLDEIDLRSERDEFARYGRGVAGECAS